MQIWSYQLMDTDLMNDLRPFELLEAAPTGWWKTRDEAFFAMLADRLETIESDQQEDPEFEGFNEDRLAWLDPGNWIEDQAGCVQFDDDYIVAFLVTGVLNED